MTKLIHVKNVTIERLSSGKNLINVYLPPKSEWKNTQKQSQNEKWVEEQKRLFAKTGKSLLADNNNPLQWCVGGLAIIIKDGNQEYIVAILRDKDAPSSPNHFTIATGLCDTDEEIMNPSLLAREGLEEIIIIKGNEILFPS